ncbi:uncharacterized protein I206_106877 [Kwoniella pini CBS 10737]|uniref:Uncharacterized protein n=1 Tax=Kwoniella pini CBS 10737 TaxID=1296096 RepID=A0A1B9HZT7_9TREE|nr:uncharacterized protein I206_05577 [Kwoniella pini CBS 10737]OCF48796.1 hypothetical protein I206_05577 [Kwoniella pini CBS 10737]
MSAAISPAPISDNFINSKAQFSRRSTSYDMSNSNSSSFIRRGSSTLAVVPENYDHHPVKPPTKQISPPSAYNQQQPMQAQRKSTQRSVSDVTPSLNSSSAGSLREMDKALEMKMRRTSPEKGKSKELPRTASERRRRADWAIDLVETSQGAEIWSEDQRVILVLGETTPASLAPILYDPAFSETLLLVGSFEPLPSIEALLSPSHLMSSSPNQQIFPTVQPFTPSIESNDTDAHALTVLLAQAASLAQQFRSKPRGSISFPRPRAGSNASSSASNSPPSTPPMRKRVLSNFGSTSGSASNRSSIDSTMGTNDRQRSISMYDTSNDSTPKAKNRLTSFGRDSIFGGFRRGSDASDFSGSPANSSSGQSGSLFDAVINFIPDMKNYKPERALQDMLHQAVVITTGIMPSLTRQYGKSSNNFEMPISVLHVLPKIMPTPLPSVIESFLLSLLPTFQLRCPREIFGSVVTTPVWLSPFVETNSTMNNKGTTFTGEDVSGTQVLLFGGIRCPYQVLGSAEDFRPRAFLANWSDCISMPGLIAEARRPSSNPTTSSRPSASGRPSIGHDRHLSSPPSVPYNSTQARTPPRSRSPSPSKNLNLLPSGRSSPTSIPRSMSMPMPNTSSMKRSKLNVSHTPPMSSEVDLPQTSPTKEIPAIATTSNGQSPPTPDLDSSVNSSSCASSFALGETASGRGSEQGGEVSGENVKIVNHTELAGTGKNSVHTKKGLKSWFKRK